MTPDNASWPDAYRDPGTTALPVVNDPYRYRGWRILSISQPNSAVWDIAITDGADPPEVRLIHGVGALTVSAL